MKTVTACDRCGLREVRHQLEQRGIVVNFCDDCYWGDVQQPDPAARPQDQMPVVEPAATGSRKTAAERFAGASGR
jgi:hypothetical protein